MSRMKKTVCLLLCAVLMLGTFTFAFGGTALAAENVRFEIGTQEDGVLPVTVYLTDAMGLLDGILVFTYDSAVFSVSSVVEGDVFNSMDMFDTNASEAGTVKIGTVLYPDACPQMTMKLCTINLKTLSTGSVLTRISLSGSYSTTGGKKEATGTKTITITPPHTHTYASTYTVDKKATFTANGSRSRHCTGCSAKGYKAVIYRINTVKLSKTLFVANGKVQKPTVVVKNSKGKTISSKYYTLTWSNAKSKAAGTYTVTVRFKGNYSGTKKLTYKITKIGKVTGVEQLYATGIYFRWDKVTGADGYEVYIAPAGSTAFRKVATQTNNRLKNTALKTSVKVKIRAYKLINGKKAYGDFSKIVTMKPVK